MEQSICAGAVQPPANQLSKGGHISKKHSQKSRLEYTPDHRQGWGPGKKGKKTNMLPSLGIAGGLGDQGQQDESQLQILAAISGLSERFGRVEA